MTAPLRKPENTGAPDGYGIGFYEHVARRYEEIARTSRRIAPVLAAEADAPVSSVHRWIREARRLGLLTVTWAELSDTRAALRVCPTCGRARKEGL